MYTNVHGDPSHFVQNTNRPTDNASFHAGQNHDTNKLELTPSSSSHGNNSSFSSTDKLSVINPEWSWTKSKHARLASSYWGKSVWDSAIQILSCPEFLQFQIRLWCQDREVRHYVTTSVIITVVRIRPLYER